MPLNIEEFFIKIATDPIVWGAIAGQLTLSLFLHFLPEFGKEITKAAVSIKENMIYNLGDSVASRDLSRITERTGMRFVTHAAERGAVTAATSIGTRQAAIASTGPAAPFLEVAEFGFNLLTGFMDELNLGGFHNMTNVHFLTAMRDSVTEIAANAYTSHGQEWPVIYGPFHKYADSNVLMNEITDDANTIVNVELASFMSGIAAHTIQIPSYLRFTPATSTSAGYWGSGAASTSSGRRDQMTSWSAQYVNTQEAFVTAKVNKCYSLGGVWKKHPYSSNMYCTYDNDGPGQCRDAPFPLTKEGDRYYEFDRGSKTCQIRPTIMRQKCESMGLGVTYNMDTGICNLSQQYCTRYGADNGLINGDCSISTGEQIADMIFGTSFVHSLVNIFSLQGYTPCPAGAETVGYLCQENKCDVNQDKVDGLCYDSCPAGFSRNADGLGGHVAGMCYKCPPEYNPVTGGLCRHEGCPAGTVRGSGLSSLCYPPCPVGQSDNGFAQCADNCPDGFDTLSNSCLRNADTETDFNPTIATCPSGWRTTVPGAAGMCQEPCPSGQKQEGALCYDNAVPNPVSLNLSYVPGYTCPDGGWRNDGLSCFLDLKCNTFWRDKCYEWGDPDIITWWTGCVVTQCNDGPKQTPATKEGCKSGYEDILGVCWARQYGFAPIAKSLLEVGQCGNWNYCPSNYICPPIPRERDGGYCYRPCSTYGQGFVRSAAGSCLKGAASIDRNATPRPNPQPNFKTVQATTFGPQTSRGISLHTYSRHRSTPFPSTTEDDFKNSQLGSHIQNGINAARNGDFDGLGRAVAGTMMLTNPLVVSLGAGSLANIGANAVDTGAHQSTY